jgi:hypothetical protein
MSNIVKIQNDNPLLKPNVLAVVRSELFNAVNASIAKCYADLNFKVPEDPTYLVNEVTDSILKNYPSMRLQEIPEAFAKGIREEYGKYFGLCVISFEKFIEGYLASEDRLKLVEQKNRLLIEEKTEPTAEDKFMTAKALCIQAYENVKVNRPIGLTALTVFTFLNNLEMIDKEFKAGIMKNALDLVIQDKELEASFCTDINRRRILNAELELLRDNIAKDIITKEQYAEVVKTAKRIALNNYLRNLIMDDTDLAELVEAKREIYLSGNG